MMIKTGNKLPAAVAAGALFFGADASVAHTETAPPPHESKISEKQQLRNEQARAKVVKLAKLVMNGPAARKGGQSNYTDSRTGQRFGVAGVDVQTGTLSGSDPGEYSFRVTAPLNSKDHLRLNHATAVNITEGTTEETWVTSYLSVNPKDHNSVAFHGIYADPGEVYGSQEDPYLLDAYTDPEHSNMARLTPKRLISAFHKAVLIIRAAEHHYPTGQATRMEPPFTQPPGTVTGMH